MKRLLLAFVGILLLTADVSAQSYLPNLPANTLICRLGTAGQAQACPLSILTPLTFANQSPNLFFSGPASGGAATPAFRLLGGADLPNPSASTLGGVESITCPASQWINAISTGGVPVCGQPVVTDISGGAWIQFTPVITCGAGSPTTITPTFRYQRIGRALTFSLSLALTTINTCTGALIFTLPFPNNTSITSVFSSINQSTGVLEFAFVSTSATTGQVSTPGGAFPGVNSNFIIVSGTYETQ